MHLVLVDEAIDVGDALVRLALVVEQDDLDLLAVDAARGIDRLELILGHLAVLEAVLHDHAQRDADADHAVLGLRRRRDQSRCQHGGWQQRQHRSISVMRHRRSSTPSLIGRAFTVVLLSVIAKPWFA